MAAVARAAAFLGTLLLAALLAAGVAPPPAARAAYPGYNGLLAFTTTRDGNDEIYVISPAGGVAQRLTDSTYTDDDAVWSPDGTKIAFAKDIGQTTYKIWVMDPNGANERQLTPIDFQGDEDSPTWSLDGAMIAFSKFAGPNGPDIWVTDTDGHNPVNLTDSPGWDRDPSWSPDGSKIAFRSERDGSAEIYVMDADGSHQKRLTNNDMFDAGPKWSADGTRIYWNAEDGYIHSIKPDGTDETTFTSIGFADDPAPSPDGALIAFVGDGGTGEAGIYTVKPDGTEITRIPGTTSKDYRPDWQPLAQPPAFVGDADCDGGADAVDALHVLRHVAGLPNTADCLANANVKCDDGMTAVDALLILRYVAHLSVDLPAACPAVGSIRLP